MNGASKELEVLVPSTGDWAEQGHCVGSPYPDLWYSSDSDKGHGVLHSPDVALAIRICSECPVRNQCLEYALGVAFAEDYGIWGGTTRRERDRLRRVAA